MLPPAIRVSQSQHVLQTSKPHRTDGYHHPNDRERVWIDNIIQLIKKVEPELIEDEEVPTRGKGKNKRVVPTAPQSPKRRKIDHANTAPGRSRAVIQHIFEMLPTAVVELSKDSYLAPKAKQASKQAAVESILEKERQLVQILQKWRSCNSSPSIDLGSAKLEVVSNGQRILLKSSLGLAEEYILLEMPDIPEESDLEALDFSPRYHNLLATCCVLGDKSKLDIDCNLSIESLLEDDAIEEEPLAYRISVEVRITPIFPSILEPINHIHNSSTFSIGEAQRRLLTHAFHLGSTRAEVDIPFFFSSLRPAPKVASQQLELLAQPASLLPRLLPFQRRTTHRLLRLEHKIFDKKGVVVPLPEKEADVHGNFVWEVIHLPPLEPPSNRSETEEVWYFNRLTGSLSDSKPEICNVGGLLAEEMGLGDI